ncbi:MAG: hypothetical protein JST12_20495 [Armatimonadetes bacterium]|nr:hypothetical protein [Armatimonadota bacterium]MBS1704054.1 hypothetical protein [Armatimonadota bacterium]MBS1725602.1 hypothetical protein [Armatimonadota bacterium]
MDTEPNSKARLRTIAISDAGTPEGSPSEGIIQMLRCDTTEETEKEEEDSTEKSRDPLSL